MQPPNPTNNSERQAVGRHTGDKSNDIAACAKISILDTSNEIKV